MATDMGDLMSENYLLDAVDVLTKPTRSKVLQSKQGISCMSEVLAASLLAQLEESIRGTIGIGSKGSLAHQRNMLDADALFRFSLISTTIKDWARMAGATITPDDIGATLRAWHREFSSSFVKLDAERFYIRQMTSWASQITAKLNPPRIWDLPNPCPVCGASTWWSKATREEYGRPLVIEYAETDQIKEAKAMCRACEQVWSVKELADVLDADLRHAVN
jgi:hypothetical protein